MFKEQLSSHLLSSNLKGRKAWGGDVRLPPTRVPALHGWERRPAPLSSLIMGKDGLTRFILIYVFARNCLFCFPILYPCEQRKLV